MARLWRTVAPLALAAALLVGTAACTSTGATEPSPTQNANGTSYLETDPDLEAIRATIDAINQTAGGPVEEQRAVLDDLAGPSEHHAQLDCPQATTTLGFDPSYRDLRPADETDERDGADYVLPTYISIYSGGRIIGSDLANLRFWIVDGRARTSALCVS